MQVQRRGDIAYVTMAYPSGNAMGREFAHALDVALDDVADARVLVLGGNGAHFSVGLDLRVLLALTPEEAGAFMREWAAVMRRLFLWPRPTIAAVNGNAVAGGFVLAAACDFRLSAGAGKLGMTGVSLGISYPPFVTAVLRYALSPAQLHSVLLEGRLLDASQLSGFIEPGDVHTLAERLCAFDLDAYGRTKGLLKQLDATDDGAFAASLFRADTRKRLEASLLQLSKSSKEPRNP